MKINITLTILSVFISLISTGQDNNEKRHSAKPCYEETYYWVSTSNLIDKEVDVFYVYPTLFGGKGVLKMDVTNELLRQEALYTTNEQGGVFLSDCNLFAPYYRQMSFDVLSMKDDSLNKYTAIAYGDVKSAFNYYLTNLNNGRPFIIAGHSQGSMHLIEIMKEMFDKPELMKNLIAAYLIGYSITSEDLVQHPWMKIAQHADDVGVIITYNTQSKNAIGSPVLLPGAQCVNPLNWTNSSKMAPKTLNEGAVFFDKFGIVDSIVPQFTSAQIDEKGALVAGSVDADIYTSSNFPTGVYHKLDYNFFYNNLKQNVGLRVVTYLKKSL